VLERWRAVLTLSATATALTQIAWPLTPPRLYEPYGMVDTLMRFGPTYYGTVGDESGAINVHGAMPSMHVGWAFLAGVILCAVLPGRPWVVVIAALYVAAMIWTVVVTGNHYLLDTIVGVAIVLVCTVLGRWWNRWRIGRMIRHSDRLQA
jgi:membrane-associated phospholipid phosphatase